MLIPLLLKPKLWSLANKWRHGAKSTTITIRNWIILAFGLSVMIGIYIGVGRGLWFAQQRADLAYIPAQMPLSLFLLCLFSMLIFSAAVSAFGALFLARDLDLVLSSPLRRGTFYWGKFCEVLFSASWMAVIFALPALLAFGRAYNAGFDFYFIAALVLIPFFAIPAASAVTAVTIFARIVPIARTRELLILATIAALGFLYLVGRLIIPDGQSLSSLNDILRLVAIVSAPTREWIPSHWISVILGHFLEPSEQPVILFTAALYTTTIALLALGYLTVELLHFDAYTKSRSLTQFRTRNSTASQARFLRFFGWLTPPQRGLLTKEIKGFSRDITQTIQVLMLLGITSIYLYNFSLVRSLDTLPPDARTWWRAFLLIMNLAMGDFLVTAACTRFVFPSVSLEGPSLWILQTSPLTFGEVLRVKFWCWLVPIAFVGTLVFSAGAYALKTDTVVIVMNVIGSLAICYGIVGLAIGLGAIFANFDWEHASQLAASFGSLVFMLVSSVLIGINVLPSIMLSFHREALLAQPNGELRWCILAILYIAFVFVLNVSVARYAMLAGERALQKRMQ